MTLMNFLENDFCIFNYNSMKHSYKLKFISLVTVLLYLIFLPNILAQNILKESKITGSIQLDAQYNKQDSLIGSPNTPEKILSDGLLYLNYTVGNFEAGIRYESYRNPILGIDPQYAGEGIAYRYIQFKSDNLDVTGGNFYEQFGSGVIFRTYQEPLLGIDNSVDGIRFKFKPVKGLELTALYGRQRSYWSLGAGIVRAGNLEISVNDLFENMLSPDYDLKLGMSAVSKYQSDNQSYYNLPLNVFAYSFRFGLSSSNFNVDGEYAHKNNDPNTSNYFNFNPGNALILNGSLFGDGYGFSLDLHKIDNMDFRSDRSATLTNLTLNYIPAITKQETYRLATLFPYSTQPNGETGLHANFTYTIPKESFLSGKYGAQIEMNYSRIQGLDTTNTLMDTIKNYAILYDSPFFKLGKRLYYQDISINFHEKISMNFENDLFVMYTIDDRDILEKQGTPTYGKVYSTALVYQFIYKLTPKNSLRMEFQHAWTKQDSASIKDDVRDGNWMYVLAEFTFAPHWYLSAYDEYNYGNHNPDLRIHYFSGSFAYIIGTTRISLAYGKQRGGILCIGGVCRQVPASEGFSMSLTSSF